MDPTLRLLRMIVREMGGRIISSGGRSVGFKDTNDQLRKLTVVDDDIILEQISGPDRGKKAEVACLSSLMKKASRSRAKEKSN